MKDLTTTQWIIAIETIVLIVLVVFIFLRNVKSVKGLVNWLKPSLEGENRTASGRRITAFAIASTYIIGTGCFWHYCYTRPPEHQVDDWVILGKFLLDILFVGLLWGFINQQTLVALRTGASNLIPGGKDKKSDGSTDNTDGTDDK